MNTPSGSRPRAEAGALPDRSMVGGCLAASNQVALLFYVNQCIHIYTYAHIYMYMHIYICTHIHMHIYIASNPSTSARDVSTITRLRISKCYMLSNIQQHMVEPQTNIGWHYSSNATCLTRPHSLYALFIVSRIIIIYYILRHFWRTPALGK